MDYKSICWFGIMATFFPLLAMGQERMLFQFNNPQELQVWRSVNDGVMGGRSTGRVSYESDGVLDFSGYLSLENNGGFASIRAASPRLDLKPDDVIFIRVRGDGRKYTFNIYTQPNLRGVSYRQTFKTTKDKWTVVALPVSKFVATFRGRTDTSNRLNAASAAGVGFLLGDKKQGAFNLEVDWIKAVNSGTR